MRRSAIVQNELNRLRSLDTLYGNITFTKALTMVVMVMGIPVLFAMAIGTGAMLSKRPEPKEIATPANQKTEYEYRGGEMDLKPVRGLKTIDCGWGGPC